MLTTIKAIYTQTANIILSGGFEQIQTQMNSFWKKLSDMELEKKQNAINIASTQQEHNSSAIVVPCPMPHGDYHHVNTLFHDGNDSSETTINKKTYPVPAPRIVQRYSTIRRSKPKDKTPDSPMKIITVGKPNVINKYQTDSSEDTFSEESVEIVKAPLQVACAKKVKSDELKEKNIVKPKSVSKYTTIYKNKISEAISSSETEEEQSIDAQPQLKQSTTSTLGQRSLTSLKQMIKDEDVMKGLNAELHEMVNLRLKEIGISPNWKGIPEKSYKQAIRVVNHQTELSRKKYSNYSIVREVILKILNEKIKKQSRNIKSNLERVKHRDGKKKSAKQMSTKRIKQEKPSKYPLHNTFTVDVKNEEKQNKLDTYTRKPMDRDVPQVSSNVIHEKPTSIGATPVKKKVLFDLEDSSSTSKVVVPPVIVDIAQGQDVALENKRVNIERVTVANVRKKEHYKDIYESGKALVQNVQNVVDTHDAESTTTLASSISETPKLKANMVEVKMQNMTKDDISDWDISDILT